MVAKIFLTWITVSVFGLTGITQAKQTVNVSGKLEFAGEDQRILSITYRKIGGGRFEFDSAMVINGKFGFIKEISEPIVIILSLKPSGKSPSGNTGGLDYYSMYVVPGYVDLYAKEHLRAAVVTGTGALANNDYQQFVKKINTYVDSINLVVGQLRGLTLTAEEREKRLAELTGPINLKRDENVFLEYAMLNPQSPLAAFAILSYAAEPIWTPRKKMQPGQIEKLLSKLPESIQSYPSIVSLKEELEVSKSTGAGRPIIDFSLKDITGKMVRLSDFKGQYVFLDFWASWCAPCRKENPNVKKAYENYKNRGFTVLSVSLDKADARKAWLEAISKDAIGMWTHVIDTEAFEGKTARSYYVKSIPTNFLIGPDGRFLDRNLYGEALNKALEKYLNQKN